VGRRTIPAIISTKGLCLVAVEGNGDTWTPLISARALTRLGEAGIDVLMFTQSFTERTLSLVVRQSDADSCLRSLNREFDGELNRARLSAISARGHVATISVVGAPGRMGASVVPQAFAALGKHGLQVRSVAQASSEYNVSFVVSEDDMAQTVRVLHRELGLDDLPDAGPRQES
jgi:aspartokinase